MIQEIILIIWAACFIITFILESRRDKRPMRNKIALMFVLACIGILFIPLYIMDIPENKTHE